MPKKYHINVKTTPLDLDYVFKFKIVRGENCINCGKCTKVCIYEAHKRRKDDPRKMADPNTVVCRNCFRCIQECPRGALEKSIHKDFSNIGGAYWKPDMLISLWKQAEDGSVPVSGSGYKGPFTGPGFDSMWTDMSEIVRPTRDGIHGREYINTGVDLGRKLNHLVFDSEGQLTSTVPETIDLPLPIVFDITGYNLSAHIKESLFQAASIVNTCIILPAADITPEMDRYTPYIIPFVTHEEIETYKNIISKARLVAVEYNDLMVKNYPKLKENISKVTQALTIIRVPAVKNVEDIVSRLSQAGAEIIQITADYRGREIKGPAETDGRLLKDIIRSVHLRLVEDKIRDTVTLIASGGIAMAEYVTKAMLCGADLTAIDIPLMVALGVRLYEEPEKLLIFPEGLDKIPVSKLTQRIVNLMGSWHSQILEMMGAMGIREARRLRGESGRAIFFEEIDRESFMKIFKKEKR
jgi:ferredoxin